MNFRFLPCSMGMPVQMQCADLSNITLQDLINWRMERVRENTRKGYVMLQRHLYKFQITSSNFQANHTGAIGENEIYVRDVTGEFCRGFAEYLLQRMKPNSACTYLQKLHTLLQQCVQQGIICRNPMPQVSSLLPRYTAPERCYLLQNEIRLLEKTPCRHASTKQAFLFACHTGLRLSDIETLRWSDIHEVDGRYLIVKIQVKTRHEVRIPLDKTAVSILLARQQDTRAGQEQLVFHLYSRTMIAQDLRLWGEAAGLRKHLTFHVSRHSFATLMASNQCDIFVVSELCGHASVRTTQIYAKLIDQARFRAIEKLDALFPRT